MNKIQSNSDISTFKERMMQSFDNLFVQQNCREDIKAVVNAIEKKKQILSLCEGGKGSFSTIFLPFHAGSTDFKELSSKHLFPAPLIEFCNLCAEIEGKTDSYATYNQEPTESEKEALLPLLKRLLSILPSSKELQGWLDDTS